MREDADGEIIPLEVEKEAFKQSKMKAKWLGPLDWDVFGFPGQQV